MNEKEKERQLKDDLTFYRALFNGLASGRRSVSIRQIKSVAEDISKQTLEFVGVSDYERTNPIFLKIFSYLLYKPAVQLKDGMPDFRVIRFGNQDGWLDLKEELSLETKEEVLEAERFFRLVSPALHVGLSVMFVEDSELKLIEVTVSSSFVPNLNFIESDLNG